MGKVTIVNNLPAGMEYLGVEGAGWKCSTAPLDKTVGPLAIECISDYVITLEIGQTTPQLTLLATATKTKTAGFSNQMTVSDMEGANHREPDYLRAIIRPLITDGQQPQQQVAQTFKLENLLDKQR